MILKKTLRKLWSQFQHSIWYGALLGLIPSFIVSFAWTNHREDSISALLINFLATEGLIVLILILIKPVTDIKNLITHTDFMEIDSPDAKYWVGRIKASIPQTKIFGAWHDHYPKIRAAWKDLLHQSEKRLSSSDLSLEHLVSLEDTYHLAAAQINAGSPLDIVSVKKAACFLDGKSSEKISKILVINRIKPALWFTPEMCIYHIDIYRHIQRHPLKPAVIRITIITDEEYHRLMNPYWSMSTDLDLLKAFLVMNQMTGVDLRVITEHQFTKAIEEFLADNSQRLSEISQGRIEEMQDYIRNVAFIMYCEDTHPVMAFRGRPYKPLSSNENDTDQEEGVIKFFDINGDRERQLHYDLFYEIERKSKPVPAINLAEF